MDGFSYNANFTSHGGNFLRCMAEDGIIYAIDLNNKQAVGHTNERYNQLEETTIEYYNKLVELGVIVPEKTAEEILKETQEALKQSQQANLEILQLLKELKGGNEDAKSNDNQSNNKNVPKQTKRNTASDTTSDESNTGGK